MNLREELRKETKMPFNSNFNLGLIDFSVSRKVFLKPVELIASLRLAVKYIRIILDG